MRKLSFDSSIFISNLFENELILRYTPVYSSILNTTCICRNETTNGCDLWPWETGCKNPVRQGRVLGKQVTFRGNFH